MVFSSVRDGRISFSGLKSLWWSKKYFFTWEDKSIWGGEDDMTYSRGVGSYSVKLEKFYFKLLEQHMFYSKLLF